MEVNSDVIRPPARRVGPFQNDLFKNVGVSELPTILVHFPSLFPTLFWKFKKWKETEGLLRIITTNSSMAQPFLH